MTASDWMRQSVTQLATSTVRIRRSVGRKVDASHIYGNWFTHKAQIEPFIEAERGTSDDLRNARWVITIPSVDVRITEISSDDQIELPDLFREPTTGDTRRPIIRIESIRAPLVDTQIAVRITTS